MSDSGRFFHMITQTQYTNYTIRKNIYGLFITTLSFNCQRYQFGAFSTNVKPDV